MGRNSASKIFVFMPSMFFLSVLGKTTIDTYGKCKGEGGAEGKYSIY